jgi:hypothetical protein
MNPLASAAAFASAVRYGPRNTANTEVKYGEFAQS